jgi:DNA repair protein RadC
VGSYRNPCVKRNAPIYFQNSRDAGFNRYRGGSIYLLNTLFDMNYNIENEALQVCEVQISYTPQVKPSQRPAIHHTSSIYELLTEHKVFDPVTIEHKEFFKVILLNNASRVLGVASLSEGSITETKVDIRHIMQVAILSNAVAIILCHNHPSGSLKPSMSDDQLTRKISDACKLFDIKILDHIILSSESYFSYAEEDWLL